MIDEELARHLVDAGRLYLLWELYATGNRSALGFDQTIDEEGIEDAPRDTQVETYVEQVQWHFESLPSEDFACWLEYAERQYGGLADAIIDHVDPGETAPLE